MAGRSWLWRLADSILCLFIFFPSLLFYWRGIWDLYGAYIFPENELLTNWVAFSVGCLSIFGYILPAGINWLLSDAKGGACYVIVSRVYMYFYGVLAMAYWRGLWGAADYYLLPYGWTTGLIGLFVCYPALILLTASRTVIFPPFTVSLDTRSDLLIPSTKFQTQVRWHDCSSLTRYLLDSCVTQYVIMSLTVLSWRSCMTLCDELMLNVLSDGDAHYADVTSLLVGLTGSLLLFLLELPLAKIGHHLRNRQWIKLIYEDTVFTIVFFIESFLWRGAWNLNITYIISDTLVGGWVNHCLGTVLLMSLQLFSFVGACGCTLDLTTSTSDGSTMWNTKYLRHYFKGGRLTESYDVQSESSSSTTSASCSFDKPIYKTASSAELDHKEFEVINTEINNDGYITLLSVTSTTF